MTDGLVLLNHNFVHRHIQDFIIASLWYAGLLLLFLAAFFVSLKPILRTDVAATWLKLSLALIIGAALYGRYINRLDDVWLWMIWLNLDVCLTFYVYAVLSDRNPFLTRWERWHTDDDENVP